MIEMLRSRTLSLVAGLVMVGGGIWFTALSSHNSDTVGLFVGGTFTTLGGALLSWESGVVVSRVRAIRDVNDRIAAVSQNLAASATRIRRAVEQAQAQQMDQGTTLALISQATTMIYGQIDQIQHLIGQEFDSDAQMITVTELEKLEQKLDRDPEARNSPVREDVARILRMSRQGRDSESIDVKCPECSRKTLVSIGLDAGSTSSIVCPACALHFNVHRASSGAIFTRSLNTRGSLAGQPLVPIVSGVVIQSAAPKLSPVIQEVACAGCEGSLRMKVYGNELGPKTLVCLQCATGNRVDPRSLEIVESHKYAIIPTPAIAKDGSIPIVECPLCREQYKAVLRDESKRYAFCTADSALFAVDESIASAEPAMSA